MGPDLRAGVDYTDNPINGGITPGYGIPVPITGWHLVDSRASYGFGLETFIMRYPLHFDWSWKTMFDKTYEDAVYAFYGGSQAFRRYKFTFWIGYDW